jgi:hypothetical protein
MIYWQVKLRDWLKYQGELDELIEAIRNARLTGGGVSPLR